MQAFFFFFWGGGGLFSCVHAKRKTRSEAFLAETDVTSTAYSKDVELFRNGSVHVDYFETSEHFSGRKKEESL